MMNFSVRCILYLSHPRFPSAPSLDENGHLKLADFGLAKTTASAAADNPDDDVLNALKKVIPLKVKVAQIDGRTLNHQC
jgi:serine/threonine protein kinase